MRDAGSIDHARLLPRLPPRPAGRAGRCPHCGSPRLLRHPELDALAIAHVDCDAFYATIEKRDDPTLADKPVIVGGRKRGVVLTACYVARTFGVRSAMPMFEARRLCPHASVVPPDMEKYARVGREVRGSHAQAHAAGRAGLDRRGVHGSVRHRAPARHEPGQGAGGLRRRGRACDWASPSRSACPATSSSPRSPPTSTSRAALRCSAAPRRRPSWRPKPVTIIFGVGKVTQQRLARDGLRTIGDLQRTGETELTRRYGDEGARLARLARGIDDRPVEPRARGEEHLVRNHVRATTSPSSGRWSSGCGACARPSPPASRRASLPARP